MPKIKVTKDNPFGLSRKQKKFSDKYIETDNALQAAKLAYPNANENTIRVIPTENLDKPRVQAYIQSKLAMEDVNSRLIIENLAKELYDDNPVIRLKALELLGKYLKLFSDKPDYDSIADKVKEIGWGAFDNQPKD